MKKLQGDQFQNYERVEIHGKSIWIPYPVNIPQGPFVGRADIMEKALAAWTSLDGLLPLNFRLYGPPGVGKNAIVYELARILKKDLYIINGHEELGPEDIACSATMTSKNTIEYVASPLFAAMLRGGIFFFDEIGKAPTSALDPLASVLDERRTLSSVLAGIHLKANDDFLFCAALNQDEEEGIGLPGFIDQRTRPAIYVGYPKATELEAILKAQLPMLGKHWIEAFILEFKDKELSPRTAINLLSYAFRLYKNSNQTTKQVKKSEIKRYLEIAYKDIVTREEENKKDSAKSLLDEKKKRGEENHGLLSNLLKRDGVH